LQHPENEYLNMCRYVLENGNQKSDRTGTGTYSVFGYQMRFDLQKGFPLLTTKRIPFRLIASEFVTFYNIIIIFGMNGHSKIGLKVMNIKDLI
jgi:thymidylate synthase